MYKLRKEFRTSPCKTKLYDLSMIYNSMSSSRDKDLCTIDDIWMFGLSADNLSCNLLSYEPQNIQSICESNKFQPMG